MISILETYGAMLFTALGKTLLMTLLSLIFAMVIGMIFGLMNVGHNRVFNFIGTFYVDAVRGVPLIVLAYFIYFGVPAGIQGIGFSNFRLDALQAGTIALSMNCGAYMAEIIRAGIESVDRGQMEAGRSLGLPYGTCMALIVVPQAVRTMIPSIINQFIGFPEPSNVGKTIVGNTFRSLETWAIIGVMYMVVIVTLSKAAKWVERRVNRGR